jgi:hypothetical protein
MRKMWRIKPQYYDEVIVHSEEELNEWCLNKFMSNNYSFMGKIEINEYVIACETTTDFEAYVDSMIRDTRIATVLDTGSTHTQYRKDLDELFTIVEKSGHNPERLDFIRKCLILNGWKESNCREILGRNKRYFVKSVPEKLDEQDREEYFERLAKVKNFETEKHKRQLETIKIK